MRTFDQKPEQKKKRKEYQKTYYQKPGVKERIHRQQKKHREIPEVKKKLEKYRSEYFKRPDVIERRKTVVPLNKFVESFFTAFNRNNSWQKEGIEKMSGKFSKIACELSNKEQCRLQEKILLYAPRNALRVKKWKKQRLIYKLLPYIKS